MEFIMEIVVIIICGLLGAFNIHGMVTAFMDKSYFTGGLSLMATVVVITYLVKTINEL